MRKPRCFAGVEQCRPAAGIPQIAQTTKTETKPSATTTADGQFYTHQPGEMRASKLIGTKVTNAANESVGEINDVVLAKDGKVAAVIIGVGGFLGMGERECRHQLWRTQVRQGLERPRCRHCQCDQGSAEGRAGLEVGEHIALAMTSSAVHRL